MDTMKDKTFTFTAHRHKISGPTATDDYTVTLTVDQAEQLNLAPFLITPTGSRIEITVRILE